MQGDDDAEPRARRLDDYARLGARADRPFALLAGALPRLALAGGLAGIALAGDLDRPGDIALALGGVLLASQALRRLAVAVETLTSAALARQALEPILRAERAASPPPRHERCARRPAPASRADGALRVRGLSVRRGGRTVLRDVDLDLQPGDRAVLAGASGAGKSTLATALAGHPAGVATATSASTARSLPTPAGATASASSPSTATTTSCWRRSPSTCSWAAAGRPATTTSPTPPRSAPSSASGRSFSACRPGSGQTIGETGWRLSQGERARLCLARALLADHDVLILDEPLGALDPQTARTVLAVARRRARTLVVISQE